jgi:hypothetical protein
VSTTPERQSGNVTRLGEGGGDRGSGDWGGRVWSWDWGGGEAERRPRVPWIGVFLLVFGGLLLLERALPQYRDLGNIAVLAAGLAFLVVWAVGRDVFPLYAGALLTAASAPGVLRGLGVTVEAGVGAFAYGVAFLFISLVRASRGGGWGWQAILGAVLVALGASQMALPDLAQLALPAVLVILGVLLVTRGRRAAF